MQFTNSPPTVVDIDGDGKNEVVAVPNIEKNEPYETQAWGLMVLEYAGGDGSRSAMRKPGWELVPRGSAPILVDGYYPPGGVPSVVAVDVLGDANPELIVSLNDGFMYCFDSTATLVWRYDYRKGMTIMYASEAVVADLNKDGRPEVIFTTFGDPEQMAGHLIILDANGKELFDVTISVSGETNGNGNGAPAAPAVGGTFQFGVGEGFWQLSSHPLDIDGDGQLEIVVQNFEGKLKVYTVPGSGTGCVLWATGRGGPRRTGAKHT